MSPRASQIVIEGLRKTDAVGLYILVQDVLRQPIRRISAETLSDLFALSELEDQLPKPLLRDLEAFCHQKIREIQDLPDGKPMAEFLDAFLALPAASAPRRLRATVETLDEGQTLSAQAAEAWARLLVHWESCPPEPVRLPVRVARREATAPPPAASSPASDKSSGTRSEPRAPRAPRAPAADRDERRPEWIREDVASRLAEYGEKGLKEPVLVGGTLHRSPFRDLTASEILAELRALKREGIVHFSAGRWSLKRSAPRAVRPPFPG